MQEWFGNEIAEAITIREKFKKVSKMKYSDRL